jgi:hypothetical protein
MPSAKAHLRMLVRRLLLVAEVALTFAAQNEPVLGRFARILFYTHWLSCLSR